VKVFKTRTREFYSTYLKISRKEQIPFSGFVNESEPGLIQKFIRLIRSHVFIPDPRKGWNRFAIKKASELIREENIPTIITTSPPHSTQLIGRKLKNLFPSINWIADFRDPWMDIFYFDQLCHSPVSMYLNRSMERSVLLSANKVIVVSNSMKKGFIKSYSPKIVTDNIIVLSNGYDEEDFKTSSVTAGDIFTITYTGTLASNYNINALLEAAKEIKKKVEMDFRLRFIGEVCPEYQATLKSSVMSDITELIPRVGHETVIRYLLSSHLLLLVIPKAPNNEAILTGKIFEYMAARKPIIGIGPVQGDAAAILKDTHAGTMFDYSDVEGIIGFLSEMITRFNDNKPLTQGATIEKYSRANLTKELIRLF
jgi:glycosyltransferase involved in cell wall biosynthesis